MKTLKNYIDGEWRGALSGETAQVINPATGEVLAEVAASGSEDAELAVEAAKKSFYETGQWRRMSAQDRADLLLAVADQLDREKEDFSILEAKNQGKPVREAECDIDDAVHCFRYYAGLITKPYGGVYDVNDGFGQIHAYTVHEPVGVCGLITPWNYPLLMAVWKIAPALAAGNSVVFKPASVTPLTAVKLFEIFDRAGLPKGCVNLVMGSGSTAGHALAESPDVDMVSFTGSTQVGQSIAAAAVGNLKKTGLELGGKSPNIIFADADMEAAVEWAMLGVFFNQGEVCSAGSRILVQRSIHDQFVQRLVQRAENLTIGNPLDNPDIGAMVSESHMETVLNYISIGKEEGAKCLCGGKRYTEGACAHGFFIEPTVFDSCSPQMRIVQEEIFGPVVTIQTFDTEEEAIRMANDTEYGLAGAVFTRDNARALRVIREIRAGITWINCYNPCFNEAPWGGYKMSGQGRELGVHGLEEYQEIKQININLTEGPLGWYQS